ncbi:MAG: DUF1156 domain-containing protein [Anaerolineae bacterium]|nr:DUF1156 domain-containing protein [Anaerolineae bacterium]
MQHDRRLIEDSLPLEAISAQSAREKSIRHGHISTLHIWWARRPLAAMRAAIFASLIPAPKDDAERAYLHELIADISDWDHVKHGNSPRIEEAKALIKKHYPDAPPKVLDPFMGGGSTGLEALRLGCEAHGVELNPVAYLIELCTLVYPQKYGQPIPVEEYNASRGIDPTELATEPSQMRLLEAKGGTVNPLAEDVRRWGNWVLEEARKDIGHLYKDLEGNTIVGYIWARTAKCPNPACGVEMPMVRQWWLAKTDRRRIAIHPMIDETSKRVTFEIAEVGTKETWPDDGSMVRGSIVCLVCGQSPHGDFLREEGRAGRLGAVPMAAIYERSGQSGKGYRPISDFDRTLFVEAEELLAKRLVEDPDALPSESLPPYGTLGFRVNNYGLVRWGDLFNARQALALITFVGKAGEAYERVLKEKGDEDYTRAVATYLAIIVDRIADYISTLSRWVPSGEFLGNTFTRQALPMVWDYPELNPFGGGSGDWIGALDWVGRVIEHCSLSGICEAYLRQGDATRSTHTRGSISSVITDPPYYDAVPYADLSDFFYVWLKRSIGDLYPDIFATPLTPKSAEIIQEPERHASNDEAKQFYETQMTAAFGEAQRVIRDDGVFLVVFAHKSTSAWETLINSLLQSGLVVTASWPLHTERPGRLRAQESAALASSIFIVCRKRTAADEGIYDDVHAELRTRIKERLDFFWSEGIRGADFFISAIGPAVEVFGRYKTVRKLSGEVVSVSDLLTLIQEAVADYALGQIMNGRYRMGAVDAPSRFYVMYRWSYSKEKLPFDDARRLAQALGAEVDELIHRLGLLKQSGESVNLLGPLQREKVERLGERGRGGADAPLIDLVHRAALLWRAGDRMALANYLTTHAMGREDALRAVAQALVNVLPDGDRERQLLEGFLAGQDNLPPPDVGREQRLPGME